MSQIQAITHWGVEKIKLIYVLQKNQVLELPDCTNIKSRDRYVEIGITTTPSDLGFAIEASAENFPTPWEITRIHIPHQVTKAKKKAPVDVLIKLSDGKTVRQFTVTVVHHQLLDTILLELMKQIAPYLEYKNFEAFDKGQLPN